jgi:3-oxoacyl-[acyl-carrier-protein] synthase-3
VGTTIDALAVTVGRRARTQRHRGALGLADAAATDCLRRAGLDRRDVGLLLNAGIYHDGLLGEPALAALIQQDIGANPEDPHAGHHGTFSFDVANGACGVLTALRVADGFLRARTIEHALVVASDADPGRRLAPGFPYSPVGAALACSWTDEPAGLVDFRFVDGGTVFDPGVAGSVSRATVGREGRRNRLRITVEAGFADQAAALAARVATDLLADHGIAPRELDAVVANPLDPAFLTALGRSLGSGPDAVVVAPEHAAVHTAGLAVALDEARRQGGLRPGAKVLVVSAGAGPTAGAALLIPR